MRNALGAISTFDENGGMGAGGGGRFSPWLDPITGKPFTGTYEQYLAKINASQYASDPNNHNASSGPSRSPDMMRQLMMQRIRMAGNDPSAYTNYIDNVNSGNPQPIVNAPQQSPGFGFSGQSFQGMGQQGNSLQNQLALLLGRR